jgi:hypothetical protein
MEAMHKYPIPKVLAALSAMALLSVIGCNTAPDKSNSLDYRAVGVLVQDINRDTTKALVEVRRGGDIFAGATVRYGVLTLLYNSVSATTDSVYSLYAKPATLFAGDQNALVLRSGGTLVDSLPYNVTDSFSLLSRVPSTDTLQPPWTLSLDWGGSDNADTYVMVAVKAAEAYTGTGYSAYAANQVTAGTIPADAFLLPGTTGNLDTGKYYIYVYAISDSPDSALADAELPVPLPTQFGDNISQLHLNGRFGTVMVCRRDSIYVATIR